MAAFCIPLITSRPCSGPVAGHVSGVLDAPNSGSGTGTADALPADILGLADNPRIVAIGETGLDYYRLEGDLEWQRERFRTHIKASRITRKPLIIHTRSASEDTIRIMLIETDSPYLAPVPHRGKRNEPAYVARVVESLAQTRGVDPARLAEQTSTNFVALFG